MNLVSQVVRWFKGTTVNLGRDVICPVNTHPVSLADVKVCCHTPGCEECAEPRRLGSLRPRPELGQGLPLCPGCRRVLYLSCPIHNNDLSMYALFPLKRAASLIFFGANATGKSSLICSLEHQLTRRQSGRILLPHFFHLQSRIKYDERYKIFAAAGRYADVGDLPPMAFEVADERGHSATVLLQDVSGENSLNPDTARYLDACALLECNTGVVLVVDPFSDPGFALARRGDRPVSDEDQVRLEQQRGTHVLANFLQVVTHRQAAFSRSRCALVINKRDYLEPEYANDPESLIDLATEEFQARVRAIDHVFQGRFKMFTTRVYRPDAARGVPSSQTKEPLITDPDGIAEVVNFLLHDLGWPLLKGDEEWS